MRLSNASGRIQSDHARDMRSAAFRVHVSPSLVHDFLMTNGPANHARNARQMVVFARAMARSRLLVLPRLLFGIGPFETIRMLANLRRATRHTVTSLALETYWSRAAILWGAAGPVKYFLRPAGTDKTPEPNADDPNYLRTEFAARLREQDVAFDLFLQRFVDEKRTPIEDGAVEWTEQVSPPIPVARLILHQQDVNSAEGRVRESVVDQMAFDPWHAPEEFRPVGNLNRSRKAIYAASAGHRLGFLFHAEPLLRNRIIGGIARGVFRIVNKFVDWHRLPTSLGLLNLAGFRHDLRHNNLHDTEDHESPPSVHQPRPAPPEEARAARSGDGSFNDLSNPRMGSVNALFGRNVSLARCAVRHDLLATPDPIVISNELLRRRVFLPARSLNILAAAWIQFQVHDWVDHRRFRLHDPAARTIDLPVPSGGSWQNVVGGPQEPTMRIFDNVEHRAGAHDRPPVFSNSGSHWWDASQVYGRMPEAARLLRVQDGNAVLAELRLQDGFLPEDVDPALAGARGIELTGFNDNWWLGLSALHTIFAREHNTICAALRAEYRGWSEDKIYNTARLVVAALIAKIHTIEWTPAILATEAIDQALNANWSGAPRDWLSRLAVWLVDVSALKGIPESMPDHHGVPFSLTEEFVSVYRLHPLMPDDYCLFDHRDGRLLRSASFNDIQAGRTLGAMRGTGLTNVLYSFGVAHPGAITLYNYPEHLRQFERINGERIDLAVVDLVRDRRRGVPRYNDFLEMLRKPRVSRFEDVTNNRETARHMREIYGDVDCLDTMVGLLAETPPENFGFSDTAFRIFILMASRRLQSDRFLTVDYRPEVYSPLGIDWVARNGMTSIILRHCPELAGIVPRSASAFAPWRAVA
jgi:hypothetical protein